MNFKEFKEQIQLGIKISELIKFKYVPLMSQQIMIENIKSICLKEDNNLKKIDYMFKDLFTLLYVSVNYTDLEFDNLYDDEYNINFNIALDIYDYFKELKIDKYIYNQSDCQDFIRLLDKEIEQEINIKNSVSFVLAEVLNNIVNKLPSENTINSIMKDIPALLNPKKQTKKRTTPKKTQG